MNSIQPMNARAIEAFIDAAGIAMEYRLVKDGGYKGPSTWSVTLAANRANFTTTYTMGAAHRPKIPDLPGVLYSLSSDAGCVRYGQTFEDFCGELGYDSDSRTAEKTFNACRDEWAALIRMGFDLDALDEVVREY